MIRPLQLQGATWVSRTKCGCRVRSPTFPPSGAHPCMVPCPNMSLESDLYAPVKALLEGQGYSVKGEVRGCDVVAVRGKEPPVIVELKRAFGLGLVLQGVDRLALSDAVYLAIGA